MKTKKKYKKGGKFPDLNKDGKITRADILKGRGVFKEGGRFKDMLKGAVGRGALFDAAKFRGGMLGGVAGALEKRKEMKSLGAKPTFKGLAKGFIGGSLPGFAGGLAERMMGDAGDRRVRKNEAFKRGGRLRK